MSFFTFFRRLCSFLSVQEVNEYSTLYHANDKDFESFLENYEISDSKRGTYKTNLFFKYFYELFKIHYLVSFVVLTVLISKILFLFHLKVFIIHINYVKFFFFWELLTKFVIYGTFLFFL